MRKNIIWGLVALFAQLILTNTATAADVVDATVVTAANISSTAVHGRSIILGTQGSRYVYVSPYSNAAARVRVSPGTRIVLTDTNNYIYTGRLFAGGTYASDYLADQSEATFATQGAKVTAVTALGEISQVSSHIQTRIASVMQGSTPSSAHFAMGTGEGFGKEKGMSSGDVQTPYGVWGQLGWSRIKDDNPATEFKADIYTVTLGFDVKVDEDLLLGLAYSYNTMNNGETLFNRGSLDQKSHTVTPYLAWRFDDMFSLDVMGGYSGVDKDFDRTPSWIVGNTIVFDPNGAKVTGEADADRWFVGVYGNAVYSPAEDTNLWLRVGYSYFHEKTDAYVESVSTSVPENTVKLGTFSATLRGSYLVENMFEPFIQVGYEGYGTATEFTYTYGNTNAEEASSGYMVGGGFNFVNDDNLSGGVEVRHTTRDRGDGDVQVTSVIATLRYVF